MKKTTLALTWLQVFCTLAVRSPAQSQRLPDVIYMDQPNGIEYSVYASTWPSLSPYIDRLKASQSPAVEADLQRRATAADVSDGELNLLAQLQWQRGSLDAADIAVARAVSMRPNQSLNAFQQAMVTFAHLR